MKLLLIALFLQFFCLSGAERMMPEQDITSPAEYFSCQEINIMLTGDARSTNPNTRVIPSKLVFPAFESQAGYNKPDTPKDKFLLLSVFSPVIHLYFIVPLVHSP